MLQEESNPLLLSLFTFLSYQAHGLGGGSMVARSFTDRLDHRGSILSELKITDKRKKGKWEANMSKHNLVTTYPDVDLIVYHGCNNRLKTSCTPSKGGIFLLAMGAKVEMPEGVTSKKEVVECLVVPPSQRWQYDLSFPEEYVTSEIFVLSGNVRCKVSPTHGWSATRHTGRWSLKHAYCLPSFLLSRHHHHHLHQYHHRRHPLSYPS